MFESSEHTKLGELYLPGLPENQQKLPMANGLELSFGQICALAGDYFAVAREPICFGKDENERNDRFLNAYGTLAYAKRKKVRKILGILDEQTKAINDAMSRGEPEYKGIQRYKFKEVMKAIFYTKFDVVSQYFMALDHMNENATLAHQTGHMLAMEAAAKAYFIQDPAWKQAQLAYAYSLEAFACHFLTDHFASGHIRTPTLPLYFEYGKVVGGLFTTFMHGEDNTIGLNVHNTNGDAWKAYGDAHLFDNNNQQNQEMAIKTVKIAINEVYTAFQTGSVPSNNYSRAYNFLPKCSQENPSPLFIDNSETMRIHYRAKLDDIHCQEYKKLKKRKVPYVLTHFFVRFLKENLSTRSEHKKLEKGSHCLKHHSLFKRKKHDCDCHSPVVSENAEGPVFKKNS